MPAFIHILVAFVRFRQLRHVHFQALHFVLAFPVKARQAGQRETGRPTRRRLCKVLGNRCRERGADDHHVECNGDNGYRLFGGGRRENTERNGPPVVGQRRDPDRNHTSDWKAQNDDQFGDYSEVCYGRTTSIIT